MATDTGRGSRKGAVKKRSQRQTKMMGHKTWTKRSRTSGEFLSQKKPGLHTRAFGESGPDYG
jgi:hypothetical protein